MRMTASRSTRRPTPRSAARSPPRGTSSQTIPTTGGAGILIVNFEEPDGAYGTVVQGNYIGTDITGTLARGNNIGIDIEGASSSLIGTDGQDGAADALEGNLISGNLTPGSGSMPRRRTSVARPRSPERPERRGRQPDRHECRRHRRAAIGNDGDGIDLIGGTSHNSIGVNTVYGPANADQRNLISGNTVGFDAGVYIDPTSSHNTIAGNLIGTSLGGTSPLANDYGVYIQGPLNVVGTTGQDGLLMPSKAT